MDFEQLKVLIRNTLEATALYFSDHHETSGDINDAETARAWEINEAMQGVYRLVGGTPDEIAEINKYARNISNMFIAVNRIANGRR